MTTPQMDWLDDQRRKRAVSSDDIVQRLVPFFHDEQRMPAGLIRDVMDEIERLRAELDDVWAIANGLATRIENISSGNHAALQAYDNALQEARRG